jgi:HEAT repeat protein
MADEAFYQVAASVDATVEQRLGAISCLRCIGFPAVPSLRAALALEVPTSGLAASVLAELFEPQLQLIEPMESALRKLVASRRSQDCGDVASAMSSYLRLFRGMGRVPAADLLAELLRDRCEFVRQDALAAIGSQAKSRCGARPLVEQMATRDPSGAARSAARTALRSAACVQ